MGRVSDALNDWFDAHKVEWPRRDALLAWTDAQGDDLRAAWRTCPRADDLMGLAGALQPPLKRVVVMTGRLVRPSLSNVTKKDALATRIVYLAENWGAGNERATSTATEQFEGHMRREGERFQSTTLRLSDLCADAVGELVQTELSAHRERFTALAALPSTDWIDEEASRALHDPETVKRLRALGAKVGLAQREVARMSTLASARALGRAVGSAHSALKAFAGISRLSEAQRAALDDGLVNSLAEAAVKAESDVYGWLATALEVAANATAHKALAMWCEGDDFLPVASRALFETAHHQLTRPGEPIATLRLHHEMERVRARTYADELGDMADTLRVELPFEVLARGDRYV
ncbi:MAG: hypothetical protein U0326_26565 [Polyangiales bacterium]